ncbi:acetyl-CoA carboxylase biotin carboxylase subunit [Prosthecodimorpha staleyi]|uniref:Acetyl/propionyl/methylcrotonyl-CoA carboxylase subunit alpha n=1 Tax=Prosthecodimorpha staleyi TaxID=2840188 RepID=A0A947D156_9HYPH|nr:acetyl/propionyl/methylcrotonyl-CoA carboxylase subunit alpha [Prosthecodimorpha staleyi]MBT9289035.1 acetyl/propionyl/methylcrotonyl-CoA carboxylase subunit alpha [Prosthecodimorpha staleyi]
MTRTPDPQAPAIRPITRILVANRGEIAVRVMRTARRMGIGTVAVYSDADATAAHVAAADEAVRLGPAPARDSYLKVDAILEAARVTGADAIHPGYGFLSENAAFAEACAVAGIVFVGPPASAIRAMGSKSAAKQLMERAGVPLVPGYHGDDQDPGLLAEAAAAIGYPVLIKASAGGGGKGMKVVESAAGFAEALASARREAANAFGDDRVLVEKYLTRPRHIEIQVFADSFGETVHLFERDCSIQRRHQKVIEEAPAPGMTPERRAAMGKAAVEAARAVGYVGAGTVEFIAEGDGFYFMEMNTRLQVEHPVTESITGQDLVEWQIRVARGEPLPLRQEALSIAGHAVEVRLYAEDPAKGFLPQTGRLAHLVLPEGLPGIRVDAGVRGGDTVSVHYDPMIAKIIATGADRAEALGRLARALDRTEVVGLRTNRAFLAAIARHPAFAAAELDTGFIARHEADLLPAETAPDGLTLALAAAAVLGRRAGAAVAEADPADRWSPWNRTDAFRLNRPRVVDLLFEAAGAIQPLRVELVPGGLKTEALALAYGLDGWAEAGGRIVFTADGRRRSAAAAFDGDRVALFLDGAETVLRVVDPRAAAGDEGAGAGRIAAPMPGTVVAVAVKPGDAVEKGQALVVVEAMKMEHTLRSPRDGKVAKVNAAPGDLVAEGAELVVLEEG